MKPFSEAGVTVESQDEAKLVATVLGALFVKGATELQITDHAACLAMFKQMAPAVAGQEVALPIHLTTVKTKALGHACSAAQMAVNQANGVLDGAAKRCDKTRAEIDAMVATVGPALGPVLGIQAEDVMIAGSNAPTAVPRLAGLLEQHAGISVPLPEV